MEFFTSIGLTGRYRASACKVDGTGRREFFVDNLITDHGLNMVGHGLDFLAYCQVGTGLSEPQVGDTTLTAFHKSTSTTQVPEATVASGTYPFIFTRYKTFRFAQGEITSPITELGVGGSTTGDLFSKCRIKDSLGNNTSITVYPDEYLDITYFLDITVDHTDLNSSIFLAGQQRLVTFRPYKLNHADFWNLSAFDVSVSASLLTDASIATVDGILSYTQSVPADVLSITPYTDGAFYRTAKLRWSGMTGVGLPVSTIVIDSAASHFSSWQIGISPPLVKPAGQGILITFSVSWGRG